MVVGCRSWNRRGELRYEAFPLTDIQQAYWLGRSGVFELGEVGARLS